jgi:hypothetical protein
MMCSMHVPEWVQKEPLDAKRYARFLEVGAFQAYTYLDGDAEWRQTQKDAFMAGTIDNPILDYPYIDAELLHKRSNWLVALKQDILMEEQHPTVKKAYIWKINEKLAEVKLLQATLAWDDVLFKKYTEFVYGKPSLEVFADDCQSIAELLDRCQTADAPDYLQQHARAFALRLPKRTLLTQARSLPHNLLITQVRKHTVDAMQVLFALPGELQQEWTLCVAEEIKEAFEKSLHNLHIHDWQVMIATTSKSTISVNHEKKTILIPQDRKLSPTKLQQLIVHEIGTHVLRRERWEASQLQLLWLWLDRYERGEEGIATMREQVLDEAYEDDVWLDKHLAISLAYGLDGTPRWFRAVCAFLQDYYKLVYLADGLLIQRAAYLARENAWKVCVRTFRGTHGTPGVCFTKDAIYKEGNRAVRDLLATDADALNDFPLGKYDPTNPRHIAILQELGIL